MLRYPNFDLLRLLLAIEVAVVHGWAMSDPTFDWAGFIMAVPAFLAISGFLVLKSYDETPSWPIFVHKRALRILPALALSLVMMWILFDFFAVYNSVLNWVTGGIFTLPGVANGPLWSLAWEELAYAALALLWVLGAYRKPVLIWLLLGCAFVVVHLGRSLAPHTQMILFLLPSFFIGNLAYLHRHVLLRVHALVPWLFLLLVIKSNQIPYFNDLVELSPVGFQAFSVVWVGMAGLRVIPFRFPDLSYGIYIFHMPIILYLIHNGMATTTAEMAAWLPIPLLLVCLVSWYGVEQPALKRKPSGRAASDPLASAASPT